MSSTSGRRRATDRHYSAEDQALDQISKEAEERIQARRQARAEAREIRLKEIERQQKEEEERQKQGTDSSKTLSSYSGSRRGSDDSTDTDISSKENKDGLRDLKHSLRELEEKYRQAMVTNAQLDNVKTSHVFQLEIQKEQLEEQEEAMIEVQREYKDKCRELELLKRDFSALKLETDNLKLQLEVKDNLLKESGLVIVSSDEGELSLTKCSDIGDIPVGSSGQALISDEAAALLKKAGEGTLGKLSSSKVASLQSQVAEQSKEVEISKKFSNDKFSETKVDSNIDVEPKVHVSEVNAEKDSNVANTMGDVDEVNAEKDSNDANTKGDVDEVNAEKEPSDANTKGDVDEVNAEKEPSDANTMGDVKALQIASEPVENGNEQDHLKTESGISVKVETVEVVAGEKDSKKDSSESDDDEEGEVFFESKEEVTDSPPVAPEAESSEAAVGMIPGFLNLQNDYRDSCISFESDVTYHSESEYTDMFDIEGERLVSVEGEEMRDVGEKEKINVQFELECVSEETNWDDTKVGAEALENEADSGRGVQRDAETVIDQNQNIVEESNKNDRAGIGSSGSVTGEERVEGLAEGIEPGEQQSLVAQDVINNLGSEQSRNLVENELHGLAENTLLSKEVEKSDKLDDVFKSLVEGDASSAEWRMTLFAENYVKGVLDRSVEIVKAEQENGPDDIVSTSTSEDVNIRIPKRLYSVEMVDEVTAFFRQSVSRGSVDILSPVTHIDSENSEDGLKFFEFHVDTDADIVLTSLPEEPEGKMVSPFSPVQGYGVCFVGNHPELDKENVSIVLPEAGDHPEHGYEFDSDIGLQIMTMETPAVENSGDVESKTNETEVGIDSDVSKVVSESGEESFKVDEDKVKGVEETECDNEILNNTNTDGSVFEISTDKAISSANKEDESSVGVNSGSAGLENDVTDDLEVKKSESNESCPEAVEQNNLKAKDLDVSKTEVENEPDHTAEQVVQQEEVSSGLVNKEAEPETSTLSESIKAEVKESSDNENAKKMDESSINAEVDPDKRNSNISTSSADAIGEQASGVTGENQELTEGDIDGKGHGRKGSKKRKASKKNSKEECVVS